MILPFPKLYLYYGALALGLAFVGWRVYETGKQAGEASAKTEAVDEAKRQTKEILDAAEARWAEQIKASEQEVAEAQKARLASERRESFLAQSLASLSQQRQTVQRDVSSVPDTALHGAIVSQLGIRKETELTACFTPSEERAILQAVTDQPLCQKTVESLQEQVTAIREQVASLNQEVVATAKQVEAERQLRIRYAESYTTLYNSVPTKRRGAKCIWLWSCAKSSPLKVPSPESLLSIAKPAL